MSKKELIKQDINFLEYPLWMIDERAQGEVFSWTDRDGFIFESRYRPPSKPDILFLYYLLGKVQRENAIDRVWFSKYELLKGCEISANKQWYDRVEDSLKRWEFTRLTFEGSFYDGKAYKTLHFGIIESWGVEEKSNRLWVRFNQDWLMKIRTSTFFKQLDFRVIKRLRSPVAARMYEILIKNFQGRKIWRIDSAKLAEKIPLHKTFPSQVAEKVLPAIRRINKMADFQVDVQLLKPARGKTIFVFEKKSQPIQNSLDFTQAETEDIGYVALLALLPVERRSQKTMKKMLQAHYQRFGYDYVARNIRYAMKNSKKNFRKFFEQSLVNDWGLSMIEDEEAAAQAKQIQSERVRQEHELQKTEEKQRLLEQELLNRAREYQSNLSGTALEKLRQEAILRLDPQIQEATKQHKPAARVPLKMAMDKISIERMHINPPTPAEKEKTQES